MSETRDSLRDLPSEVWNDLEPILNDFEGAWKQGRCPQVEDYLARGQQLRFRLLVELVHLDLELRIKAGETVHITTYLEKYPELAGDPDIARELTEAEELLLRFRDTELDSRPQQVVTPSTPAAPAPLDRIGRYELYGEIDRGGMGAILKARDVELGRDLAIKVLLEAHQDNPQVVRRFVEEAQIGGQLQHPGVVPVYELGTFPDRRRYFTMKLLKGRTLATMLTERKEPAHELPRLLGIFEQVCQAVAYAHSRGVINRDLKPSNVMVGNFGEVQVLDWGLAKVLHSDDDTKESKTRPDEESVVQTVRSDSAENESWAGSVLGTLSYMAPEQARGEVARVDERADVFGLGAILCEILTGRPPFTGRTPVAIHDRAARGDLAGALERLNDCGADAELLALARHCLAGTPDERPRDAGEVSQRMTAYLASVQERLKSAELARVEAQAKAAEERKRRRLAVVAAAAVLALVVTCGSGGTWYVLQWRDRLNQVALILKEADVLRGQAVVDPRSDSAKWQAALGAVQRADDLLRHTPDAESRGRLAALRREIANGAARHEQDRKLVERLEAIRSGRGDHWDSARASAEYAAAFRECGLDLDQVDPNEAGEWIARRPVAVELAAALDDWVLARRQAPGPGGEASWRRLLSAARTADPDPWRTTLREQIGRNDVEGLRRLAKHQGLAAQPPQSLVLLALALRERGDFERAAAVLGTGWRENPHDFWINFELGKTSSQIKRPEESVRHYTAAVALRPRSFAAHVNLGVTLGVNGQYDKAITEFRTAIRLDPDDVRAHADLGHALFNKGQLDQAIPELRRATQLRPDYADFHVNLGTALSDLGKLDEAIAEYREAIRLSPSSARAHTDLGRVLCARGELPQGIAEYREALRVQPDYVEAHNNLGNALDHEGKAAEAIAEYRAAMRLKPDYAEAHYNLGIALTAQGKLDEAITEYREALRLAPDYALPHCNLGRLLQRQGKFREALDELRKGHALGSKQRNWPYPSDEWVRQAERNIELGGRLPAVLQGKWKPIDPEETRSLAELCYSKQLYGASARLWLDAFQARPALAENLNAGHRYNAACAAGLAGCAMGRDDPPLANEERGRWRAQALAWLKADLAGVAEILETNKPGGRLAVRQSLSHWKKDTDLNGVRDQTALRRFAGDERKTWQTFWCEVEVLLAKAGGSNSP